MAKISNTSSYGNKSPIIGEDFLIGTSGDINAPIENETKTFTLQGIANFILSLGIKALNNTNVASSSNQGSIRYRVVGNSSFTEMSMQISSSTYAWVIIKQNDWV
jgi:hypothetical protein